MSQDIVPSGPIHASYLADPDENGKGGWEAAKQLVFVIFKWRRLIYWLCFLFPLGVTIGLVLQPPMRRANAVIMLKGDRIPLQMAGVTEANTRWMYSPQVMQSEVELIRSRQVMGPVAKKLLAEPPKPAETSLLSRIVAWPKTMVKAAMKLLRLRPDPKTDAEKVAEATDRLIKSTLAIPVTDTNVIKISYFDPTPEGAVKILKLIIDQYMEEQALIQTGAAGLPKYYEQEKQRVETQLLNAEQVLNEWQEKNHTVSIDEQITNDLRLINNRETSLKETEEQIEVTRAKIAVLKKQFSALPERLMTVQERIANPAVTRVKEQLVAAEVALQDVLNRYTEKSRQVQDKKTQVLLLRKELETAEKQEIIGRQTTELNPLRSNLERELGAAQALAASLAAQKETLEKQVRETSERLGDLRGKKGELTRLSRVVALHKDSFELYGKKLEEARIATGLGKEKLSQVLVIAQPFVVPPDDLVDDLVLVLLSSIVGLAFGGAIAFVIEMFNNNLRTQADVEHYLGLPMLAAVPDLPPRVLLPSPDN